MDEKLRHILKERLDSYESPVPAHLWEQVAAHSSVAKGGLSAVTKWLLVAAAAASVVAASVWYFDAHGGRLDNAGGSTEQPIHNEVPPVISNEREDTLSAIHIERSLGKRAEPISQLEEAAKYDDGQLPSVGGEHEILEKTASVDFEELPSVQGEENAGAADLTQPQNVQEGSFTAVSVSSRDLTFFFMPVNPKADAYRWNFGDNETSRETSPLHTFDGPGTYSVTLETTTTRGIENVTLEVECLPEPQWFIPTIFTPNGDDRNDLFDIMAQTKYVEPVELTIFDSSGQLVFSQVATGTWNGLTADGTYAAEGNYVFKMVARNLRHQTVEKSGFIYLQR
jgi:gliding motility-associated-like protein